ncbi:hypothetical protein NX059_011659 [Plenodomus lindquistii]|nr:hypothetical protein NX059_011659 [Plenodomus lindquistii]KAI8931318.1 hypothetical protein NX059_011659 [Plenodomus lindquistii]
MFQFALAILGSRQQIHAHLEYLTCSSPTRGRLTSQSAACLRLGPKHCLYNLLPSPSAVSLIHTQAINSSPHTHFPPPTPTPTPNHSTKMSAPNANNPNEGIVGQAVNSVKNAANYVSESIQGQSAEAQKEANKQQAKGNVPGQDSLTDRASGAASAVSDKLNQEKHEGAAEANKRSV